MKRKLLFFPAWDRTDPDPSKNYGVSCVELRFVLEGEGKAVEFQLLTQWFQPHIMDKRFDALKHDIYIGKEDFLIRYWLEPFPADICCYSLENRHEDCTFFESGVSYIFDGNPCYYDYKYMDEKENRPAHDVAYWLLVEQGDEALWKYLEDYYVEVFGNAPSA